MRTIFIASVWTVAAVTCVGTGAAKDLTLTRNAESGVDSRIAYERAWDRDCKPLPTTVTVTQPPKNGTIAVAQGSSTIPASTPNSGSAENCAGKTVTGNMSISGIDAGNYIFTQGTTTATISQLHITATATSVAGGPPRR